MADAKKTAAWVATCATLLCGVEGIRNSSYPDVTGKMTICAGETKGVVKGQWKSTPECMDMLATRVQEFGAGVDKCINHSLSDGRKAAYTSFAYNAGIAAFCGSSVARFENQGKPVEACNALMAWNKVRIAGVLTPWPGLTNRREKERALCLS